MKRFWQGLGRRCSLITVRRVTVQEIGAPNLSDAIWLYGGDADTIRTTIQNARFGAMPAWSEEFRGASGLSLAEINAVATYVHQLGSAQ